MVHRKSKMFMLILVLIMIFIMQSTKVAAETNSLFYEGKGFSVELTFTNKANISENATLKVTEFYEGSKEYQDYYSQANDFIQKNTEEQIDYVRFFDISIMDGEMEIEPDDVVQVSIKYEEGIEKEEDSSLSIIHFVEDGSQELIEVNEEVVKDEMISQISFEGESFSVFGMIVFDGIDSNIKDSDSETISKVVSVDVTKEWSDGYEIHKEDSIIVSLYEIISGEWKKCEELTLSQENNWKGKFENLDRGKEYGIRETKVIAGNEKTKATYQSIIEDTGVKSWCKKEQNVFLDGEEISLVFDGDTTSLLRRSSDWQEETLRKTDISVSKNSEYGEYCRHSIATYEVWKTIWDEERQAWLIYSTYGDAYLTLLYDSATDSYVWKCKREKMEGAYLNYENGRISATVNGVTKYMGAITDTSGFVGVSEEEGEIEEFRIYKYQVRIPGQYVITNTKNETVKEQQLQADVITEKTIDYLGDDQDNPDTDVDNGKLTAQILKDLYRLNLKLEMQTDATGLDLLLVIDVSSSMMANRDCMDENGNMILRSEALRQALNQFIPNLLPENTKNRVSIVAFENESMILQEWTQDAKEVLEKVNYKEDGKMPLYNGAGTNYESALIRAHEALTKIGYSTNAKAMIFLSDGEPTAYVSGNDNLEAGNVTVDTGPASLGDGGIEGKVPAPIWNVWISDNEDKAINASNEAVESFKRHNPEIMIGTIAFNTIITDCLRNLATDAEFVTQIQNGTPNDLIEAMELITKFVPKEICVVDELSDYVELYETEPDFKVVKSDKEGKETILISPENGITKEGENVLDKNHPLEVSEKQIRLNFCKDYIVENGHKYDFSFNINASQNTYDAYADTHGIYPDTGDENTDYQGNHTSSQRQGFYSNGENTKARYSLNGAFIEKKYRKPVVQAADGELKIVKTDLDGNVISGGTEFVLYRESDEGEKNGVSLNGLDGNYSEVAAGVTDENGELEFEHLRLKVFDDGYPYYLVETKASSGYVNYKKPVRIIVYSDHIEADSDNAWSYVDKEGRLVIRNAEYVEPLDLPVTGGCGNTGIYMIGIMLITGGIFMFKKTKLSKVLMMFMALIMGCHVASSTAYAIERTDKGSITVNGVEEYANVSAYRLMDINFDYDVKQPKNPMYMWVDEVADWMGENYPEYIDKSNQNAVNEAFSTAEEVKVAELYDKLAVAIKDGSLLLEMSNVEVEDYEETAVIENLTMGNYFILIEGGLKVYRPLSANVVPEWNEDAWKMSNPTVTAKASSPSITKEIAGGLKEDNVNIGDTVSFELSAVIPSYPEHAKAKMFVISDQLSEGLTLVEDSLKVYGVNNGKSNQLLENGFSKSTKRTIDLDNKNVSFALDFDYDAISQFTSLMITYDAVLNEKAEVGEVGNGNIALLDYSNNPYVAENYSTDGDETTIYTYGVKISKVDEDTNKGLAGAEFTLSKDGQDIKFAGANGVYHVAGASETGNKVVVVDGDGFLTLKGLDAGTYSLIEVKAPDGYVKLQNSIEITISDDDVNGKILVGGQELADGYVPVTVKNDTGFTLPVTGGMGTTLFNVAGVVLMGSGLLLIVAYLCKRRNSR